jgi:adenylate cyclase
MAGTVMEHGGQVLRFIGDAALSIFPIDAGSFSGEQARNAAITAAEVACQRMEAINEERARNDEVPLGFGIALHEGEVTYGNIGTENRLEFTVIGDAANCAARIETHCKLLKRQVLVSEAIAASDPQRFESMGEHLLRGAVRASRLRWRRSQVRERSRAETRGVERAGGEDVRIVIANAHFLSWSRYREGAKSSRVLRELG